MNWDDRWGKFASTLPGVALTTMVEALVVLSLGWLLALALREVFT